MRNPFRRGAGRLSKQVGCASGVLTAPPQETLVKLTRIGNAADKAAYAVAQVFAPTYTDDITDMDWLAATLSRLGVA
jgi:hypothetical protein